MPPRPSDRDDCRPGVCPDKLLDLVLEGQPADERDLEVLLDRLQREPRPDREHDR